MHASVFFLGDNIAVVQVSKSLDCPLKLGGQRGMKALVATTEASASQRSPLSGGGYYLQKLVPPPLLRGYSSYLRRRIVGVDNIYISAQNG